MPCSKVSQTRTTAARHWCSVPGRASRTFRASPSIAGWILSSSRARMRELAQQVLRVLRQPLREHRAVAKVGKIRSANVMRAIELRERERKLQLITLPPQREKRHGMQAVDEQAHDDKRHLPVRRIDDHVREFTSPVGSDHRRADERARRGKL